MEKRRLKDQLSLVLGQILPLFLECVEYRTCPPLAPPRQVGCEKLRRGFGHARLSRPPNRAMLSPGSHPAPWGVETPLSRLVCSRHQHFSTMRSGRRQCMSKGASPKDWRGSRERLSNSPITRDGPIRPADWRLRGVNMKVSAVFVLLMAWPAYAGTTTDKFDLVCKGEFTSDLGASKPSERRYRIDLEAKRYCPSAACTQASDIAAVTPDQITFESSKDGLGGAIENVEHYVSRTTGRLVDTERMRLSRYSFMADCTVAPFTGLPSPKF